jgi:archaemetzincin
VNLRIVPVGEGVPVELLDELAAAIAMSLQLNCHVQTGPIDAAFAWNLKRNQYWSTALLKRLLEEVTAGSRILGITALDLYVPVLTFVFGEAQVGGSAAIVSLHRLRNEFYGLPPEPSVLLERAIKEALHELGHTYGLRHCSHWQCVMASSHAVERLDTRSAVFCDACRLLVVEPAAQSRFSRTAERP